MRKARIIILIIAFIACLVSWLVAGKLIAPMQGKVEIPTSGLPVENVTIKSQSGSTLAGWHIQAADDRGVVALFHGYLEKHDVLATIDFAKKQHPNQPIGVIGMSLGGAATLLASPQNIDALVIESVYSNIKTAVHNRVKARLGFLSWAPAQILLTQLKPRLGFSANKLSPIGKVSLLNSPLLVISGTADKHTTASETKQIFELAKQPKQLWLADGLAHQDIYKARPEAYKQKVLDFLNRHMRR